MLHASVIISTRNRAYQLPRLFDALACMETPSHFSWELVIIDNGSTDETNAVINAEISKNQLPIVLLSEPIPGKSRALNLGITKTKGELIIFTDDDVEPDPLWLKSYIEASQAHPQIDGFAGRVIPRWLGESPEWLHTKGAFALPRGITNTRDFGNEIHLLPDDVIPGGVNTALRRRVLSEVGTFRIDLGPGTSVPFAEDTEYMQRYKLHGGEFLYIPEALLYHCNVPERMTKDYVINWMLEVARCQVLAFETEVKNKAINGIPTYLIRQGMERLLVWIFEPRSNQRLQKKMKLFHTIGKINGYRQLPDFIKHNKLNPHSRD